MINTKRLLTTIIVVLLLAEATAVLALMLAARRDDVRKDLAATSRSGLENLINYRKSQRCLPESRSEILNILGTDGAKRFGKESLMVVSENDLILAISPSPGLLKELADKPGLANDACTPNTIDSYKVSSPAWSMVAVIRVQRCEKETRTGPEPK